MSKIKKSICVLLLSLTLIMTLPISVFASVSPEPDKVYDTYIQKPTVTETSGYAELLFYNLSTYEYAPTIVCWNCSPVYDSSLDVTLAPVQEVHVDNSGFHIFFNVVQYSESPFYAGITVYDGRYINNDYRFDTDGERSDLTFDVFYNGWQLVGANVYGSDITYYFSADYHYEFSILYAAEAYEYTALREVINSLALIHSQDSSYYESFYNYLNSIDISAGNIAIDTKSINLKLNNAVSILQSVLNELKFNSSGTFAKMLSDELKELNQTLSYCDNKLGNIELDVDEILKILQKGGKTQEWANVDNSSITDYENAENEIVKDDTDTFGNNVMVIIDEASYGTLWSVIELALQQNSIVFGFFFSVLALGIVALVLNR